MEKSDQQNRNENQDEKSRAELERIKTSSELLRDQDAANDERNGYAPRELWSKKMDFLMSIIGFSVDLAGIWRL
jgi:hypothetical protein